jgi:hypothetical protein
VTIVRADVFAVTAAAVISPLKIETSEIELAAVPCAVFVTCVEEDAVIAPVEITEPLAGQTKCADRWSP